MFSFWKSHGLDATLTAYHPYKEWKPSWTFSPQTGVDETGIYDNNAVFQSYQRIAKLPAFPIHWPI